MRTNTVLTPCGSKVRYISHLSLTPKFDEPHALKQRAVYYVYNENEHKTHALFLVSSSEFVSDPRPRVTRPAPAGHTTCARGSRDLRPRVADFVPKRNGKWPSETGNKFCKTKVRQCGTGTGSGGAALSERETMCDFICGLGTAEHCPSPGNPEIFLKTFFHSPVKTYFCK